LNLYKYHKTCLFTVIYPGCEPYLPRFFESVSDQTRDDFDLLILNDGLENPMQHIPVREKRLTLIPVSGTIAKVREEGIRILENSDYETVIFADADDFMSANRVDASILALEEAEIYVNDVSTVDEQGNAMHSMLFSGRLGEEFTIDPSFLTDKNIMGLGNTAVRKDALIPMKIPSDTIAVDWYYFTHLLLSGRSALFKNESVTFYRQHDANTAGLGRITPERFRHALKVQLQHAESLSGFSDVYIIRHEKLLTLRKFLESDANLERYLEHLKQNLPASLFWWEEVKTLDSPEINLT
jgi:hypothetical protein